MPYPENRLLPDVPAHDYHVMDRVGGSSLRHLLRSAAHYRHEQTAPDKPSDAKLLGSILHQTLAPAPGVRLLKAETIWKSEGRRDLQAMQARRDALGPDVLEVSEAHEAVRQAVHAAVWGHPEAARLLVGARFEQSFLWRDPMTDVACKGRADILTSDGVCVDVKTTALSAAPESFERQIADGHMGVQAAHYLAFALHTGLFEAQQFCWIVCETLPPYGVAVYALDRYSLMHAQDLRRRALALLARCQKTQTWPGYGTKIRHLGYPSYRLPLSSRVQRWNADDVDYATDAHAEEQEDGP